MNPTLRRGLDVTATAAITLVALAGFAAAGVVTTVRSTHPRLPEHWSSSGTGTVSPAAHGRPLVVAFVAGRSGTIASDLLGPYDVFASSPAFTTYVVAAGDAPVELVGGPALVPTHTFDAVDADPGLAPDLVVVPAVDDPNGTSEAPLRAWVTSQRDRGARILGVCAGARVLAATGMLDGRTATSHWSRIGALQKTSPDVHWVRGRTWVDDGSITTTAAVTSGIPAALHLVARLAGDDEARRVADLHPELGWTPDTSPVVEDAHFSGSDWPVGLNFVMPWLRPTIGVLLHDGVSELDAAAVFEVYSQSAAAATIPVATGDHVTTQHGLVLLTTPAAEAPRLTRRITPAGGFTAALDDLADHAGNATAASTAKMVGYPHPDAPAGSPDRAPWRPALLAGLAVLASVGVGRGVVTSVRRATIRLAGRRSDRPAPTRPT